MVSEKRATYGADNPSQFPRLMLLLRSLDRGGAERQAVTLAKALKSRGWCVSIACFYTGGPLQQDVEQAGVRLIDLAKRGRWELLGFLWRLLRAARWERPDIVYGWLPTPNVLAVLLKVFSRQLSVIWGVRSSNIDLDHYGWLRKLSFRLERRFARWADVVVANSEAGARLRIESGFPAETMRVIPNGIDTARFRFDPEGRARLRGEWRVSDSATLVGLVGRLDPMKDHPTFLAAAAKLAARDARWHFVCVGGGSPDYKERLIELAADLGLTGRLTWAGPCNDMAAVYSALDIASSSSSSGEGFANVIAEAMACGRPCVVTDVGDSAMIVDGLGIVVAPRDPDALADGVRALHRRLSESGATDILAASCRQRVVTEFSVQELARRTALELLAASKADIMGGASTF